MRLRSRTMAEPIPRRRFLKWAGAAALSPSLTSWSRPARAAAAQSGLKDKVPLDELTDLLKKSIPPLLDRHAVPGLSIALIRDAQVAWAAGFGLRDTAKREPVTVDTMFEAASLSKPTFGFY